MSDGLLGMKYCTLFKDGNATEFISCDAVDDSHRYGLSADGTRWHVEGVHLPDDRITAYGMVRGNMTGLYPVLTPRTARPPRSCAPAASQPSS